MSNHSLPKNPLIMIAACKSEKLLQLISGHGGREIAKMPVNMPRRLAREW